MDRLRCEDGAFTMDADFKLYIRVVYRSLSSPALKTTWKAVTKIPVFWFFPPFLNLFNLVSPVS